jgi:hypothetical protein
MNRLSIIDNLTLYTMYDYTNDRMIIGGVVYGLNNYRKWLVKNHEQLCAGHFIRSISVGNKTRMTYDWQSIFHKAEEYQFLKNYINEVNFTSAQ